MAGKLEGRVALVTGAGNGIGRGIAMAFAAEGAIVGVNDFKGEAAAATVAAIEAAGGRAEILPGDASARETVRELVLGLAARHGRFDIVVNNAAWVRYEPILGISQKSYDRMTGIGFGGIVWSIQAAAEAMAKGGRCDGPHPRRLGGVGPARHPGERHRAGLHANRAGGLDADPGDGGKAPGPYPAAPAGRGGRHRPRGAVPGVRRKQLGHRHHHAGGWRGDALLRLIRSRLA